LLIPPVQAVLTGLWCGAEFKMSDVKTAEIQSRIANLKAELQTLSLQLAGPEGDEGSERAESREPRRTTAVVSKAPAVSDHAKSRRTLHDLMWQGRWSLAFHLARALEVQNVPGNEFHSSLIRVWTLASQAECRRDQEARQLIQVVLDESEQPGSGTLARQMFEWATLIVLLRSIDPTEVRGFAARFTVPQELPATMAWWNLYIETLSASPRPAAKWMRQPERTAAAEELDHLMLAAPFEPVRLAASCLIMSIRCALRHVQLVSSADERLVLNSELNRATRIRFAENGTATASAGEIERAVCDLATASPGGRAWNVVDGAQIVSGAVERITIDETPGQQQAVEPPTPRANAVMSRLNAAEKSLESAIGADSKSDPPDDNALRRLKRNAARERLERYVARLSSRGNTVDRSTTSAESKPTANREETPTAPEPAPEQAQREPRLLAFVREVEATASAAKRGEPNQAALDKTKSPVNSVSETPGARSDDRRGIHEASVASAFGAEGGWAGPRTATVAGRQADASSIWGIFFNAQAVIVAGLLIIAGAVVAGLGTGLTARTFGDDEVRAEQSTGQGSTAEEVGDFQVTQ